MVERFVERGLQLLGARRAGDRDGQNLIVLRVAADNDAAFEEERNGPAVRGNEIRGKATGRNAGECELPGRAARSV
ncbi:hypothetical protein X748_09000 [Mesorhizobium sp. LNJC386A00]|nr:hypothetical protein X748_09000 [Mesorhizobium sp. LNJC386A00]